MILLAMKKYVQVYEVTRVNELSDDGYRLHTMTVEHSFKDGSTQLTAKPVYMMSLQDPSKYDDMLAFKKMPITFEEQAVPEGWKAIHHTSKEMILKRVTPNV